MSHVVALTVPFKLSVLDWSPWGGCSGVSVGLSEGPGFCGEREVEGRQFRTAICRRRMEGTMDESDDDEVDMAECGGGPTDGDQVESRPCRVLVRGPKCQEHNAGGGGPSISGGDIQRMRLTLRTY